MASSSITRIKGLSSFPNYLNEDGDGLSVGSNVVIDRDNTLEPRRGMKVLTELAEQSKQLLTYKDRVLAHYGNTLGYLDLNDPGNITAFKGTYNFTQASTTTVLNIVDHGFTVDDAIFFTRKRDYSSPGVVFFSLPSPLDEVSLYYITNVINKDEFEISASLGGPPITVSAGQGVLITDYIVNEVKSKLRIKSIELNSNLYFTTDSGIKKVSKLDPYAISAAGGVPALNIDLALDFSGSGGFFGSQTTDVEVAYRIVWGTKDANNNLILGRVSERAVITNYTRQNANVTLTVPVPQGIDTNYFYQIYRTNVFGIEGSGDEMRLVLEANYDGFSNVLTVTDSTPENIRDTGTPLYTNELSGEGILQNNERPPVSEDVTVFKNRAWFANTRTSQKLDMTFLGFDAFQNALLPADVVSATGSNPATITFATPHNITNNAYIALANTTSQDGQYQATVVSPTVIQIQVDSAGFGTDYAIYRTYLTVTKNTQINRYFFVGRPEVYDLTAQPKSLVVNGEYFNLTTIEDKIKYYFWFDVDGNGIDPAIPNRVGIKVDLSALAPTATAAEVAEKIKQTLENTADFFVLDLGLGLLTISTITSGAVTDPLSGTQVGTSLVSIAMTQNGFGENSNLGFVRLSSFASPAASIEDTAKSLVRVINFTPSSPVYAYYLATTNSLPGQFFLEEKNYSTINFTLTGTGFLSDVSFSPVITTTGAVSTNNIGNNVLMFSKVQQPESVPTVNSFRIGPQDKAIKRILALRNSLFIFKEEGVYRLTGENESTFNIALDDSSATILAPDSAVVLNNQIYCITTQGVSTVSETGVGIISRNIEDKFNRISSENFPGFETATFGVSYEADRAYLLFTVNSESDNTATICYRYNSFTQNWTTFDLSGICGVVSPKSKLHLGSDDINAIEIERKTLTTRDYVDRQYNRVTSAYQSRRMYVDNAIDMEPGDSLTQEQYLTINEFNNTVGRLKLDPQLNFNQAFAKMSVKGGADFTNSLRDLVNELNLKDTTRVTSTFNQATDVNTATDTITSTAHGLNNNDIVKFTTAGTAPGGLTSDSYYKVVNATTNTLQLTTLEPNVLVQGLAIGLGTFTIGGDSYTFNMVRDVDYVHYTIEFLGHGLEDGDIVTFTTTGTPPTGLINGRQYEIVNATVTDFQVKEVTIDLTSTGTGTGSLEEVYYYSGTTNNKKQQKEFNQIVNTLNQSEGVFFANYELSEDMEELDLIIATVNLSQNYVTLQLDGPFYVGDIIHYKSIKSEALFEYAKLGDPTSLKQVSYGTVMVESNSLNKLVVGYSTDLSGDIESTEFSLDGSGVYGRSQFGYTAFGGDGTAYPLRVVIPRQKQRCRYIRTYLSHSIAFIKYSILGISYDFEITSNRAYRK